MKKYLAILLTIVSLSILSVSCAKQAEADTPATTQKEETNSSQPVEQIAPGVATSDSTETMSPQPAAEAVTSVSEEPSKVSADTKPIPAANAEQAVKTETKNAAKPTPISEKPMKDELPSAEPAEAGLVSEPEPEMIDPFAGYVKKSGPGWYAGDTHLHSNRSDGAATPDEIVDIYTRMGYDFFAFTDHYKVTTEIDYSTNTYTPITRLNGMENNLRNPYGHLNIYGPGEIYPDSSIDPDRLDEYRKMVEINHERGNLIIINHPFGNYPWGLGYDIPFDGLEVWNGGFDSNDRLAVELWDGMLKEGRKISAVGGSDNHSTSDTRNPWMMVYSLENNAQDITQSIRGGHQYMRTYNGPSVELTCGGAIMGDSVTYADGLKLRVSVTNAADCKIQLLSSVGLEQECTIEGESFNGEFPVDEGRLYYRIEIVNTQNGKLQALTNPIYFDNK